MAEVTGPISTLPGARHDLPENTMCDEHPDRPAVARIQGETDSMGCEMHDLCAECVKEHREAEENEPMSGKCDWCAIEAERLVAARDYDEGLHGPVYYVCKTCKDNQKKRLDEEANQYYDGFYDDPDDDYVD